MDPFNKPRLSINRVYTRGGDKGQTSLVGGQRLPKNDLRIDAYGTIDELNAFLGLARDTASQSGLSELASILLRVQHELFNAGSILATLPEDVHHKQARITGAEAEQLEREIDAMNEPLSPLRSFVLPGGCRLNGELHVCRTVCRRAERVCVSMGENADPEIVKYLNRLSDSLFVWSRWASWKLGVEETLWEPNKAASRVTIEGPNNA
jgi:cob(I)alamin adenosyltransferase